MSSLLFNPLVSIIIPVYNGSNYLSFAIDSAINQTYKNIEIIVVNDGSIDNGKTKEVANKYKDIIRYFEKENGGVSSALNKGIAEAKGEYICWLSHDDIFTKDCIEKKIKYLHKIRNKKIIVYSNSGFIDKVGKRLHLIHARAKKVSSISHLLSSTINGCALVLPRDYFKNKKFNENLRYMQDIYMWAEMINDGFVFVPIRKKTNFVRLHNEQVTVLRNDLFEKDFKCFFETFIDPLIGYNDINSLKKIAIILTKKQEMYPFFKYYSCLLSEFLKAKCKSLLFFRFKLFFAKIVAKLFKLLRRLK